MARKPSKLQQQYRKEYANVKRRIKTAQKKGFIFSENIIPPKLSHPTQKDISELHSMRGEKLYKKSVGFLDKQYGELFSPQDVLDSFRIMKAMQLAENLKYRSNPVQSEERPNELDIVFNKLSNWVDTFETGQWNKLRSRNARWEDLWFQQEQAVSTIQNMLETAIQNGIDEYYQMGGTDLDKAVEFAQKKVAKNIQKSGINLEEAMEGVKRASKDEAISRNMNNIIAAILGRPMVLQERKIISALGLEDSTDYTSKEKYPI